MPTFVLIHGSFCQGSIWAETAAALRDDGHRAEAVDLPSSGTAAAQLGDLRAETDAVRRALDRTGAGAVLVAHSGGGMVLTEFAGHPADALMMRVPVSVGRAARPRARADQPVQQKSK